MLSSMVEDGSIPQSVYAIALDANSGNRGMLDLKAIGDLVDVLNDQELNVEIWIPEPVLWEWAEHAHALATNVVKEINAKSRLLERSGIEEVVTVGYSLTINELIAHLEEKLADFYLDASGSEAVRILELGGSSEAASEGIRDQILQRGAGRRKNDVKTGASDSSSWRLITAEGAERLSDVVLISKDSDVSRHFAGNVSPILLGSVWEAKRDLQKLKKGSEAAIEAVMAAVLSDLPSLSEPTLARAEIDGTPEFDGPGPSRRTPYEPMIHVIRVGRVIRVSDIEVSAGDLTATAVAELEVDVAVGYLTWDSESDFLESVLTEELDISAFARVSAEAGESHPGAWSAWVDTFEF
jgi:hypothetical protein